MENIQVVNDDTTSLHQYTPRMVADEDGFLYVVWRDQRDGTEIYFATTYSDSMSVNIHSLIPFQIKLYQNYPNPFNPETTIRYDLPYDTNINLMIYDVTGREVVELVNGRIVGGRYSVVWNAGDVASGIYFYQMTTEFGQYLRKMVILK